MCVNVFIQTSCTRNNSYVYLIGGHGAFSTERDPISSHPETNIRFKLSLCGHHDRRPAKPACHPATTRTGVYVCVCVSNRHLRKDGKNDFIQFVRFISLTLNTFSFNLITVCLCLCVPGPGAMPSHCHAHGQHAVSQRKETDSTTQ